MSSCYFFPSLSFLEELMVQLHIFTMNDYLPKSYISDNNQKQNQKKKFDFFFILLNFWSKNVISEISGRLLIGQEWFLLLLLLVYIFIEFKKGRNDLTDTYGS